MAAGRFSARSTDVQPLQGSPLKFSPGPSGRDTNDWEGGLAPWPGFMMSPDRVYR